MKIRRALAFFIDWFFCAFLGLVGGVLVFYKISTRVSDVKGIFFQSPEGMEAFIALEPFKSFWPAEEYHQDYYRKHPEEFRQELIDSGRIKG